MAKTPEEKALERRTRKRNQDAIAETERSLKAMTRQSSGIRSLLEGVAEAPPMGKARSNRLVRSLGGNKNYARGITGLIPILKNKEDIQDVMFDPNISNEEKIQYMKDNNIEPREYGARVMLGGLDISESGLISSQSYKDFMKDKGKRTSLLVSPISLF